MTKQEAIQWVRDHPDDETPDDETLDAACRALGYDPEHLAGDDEDPNDDFIDRRWDTVCAEVMAIKPGDRVQGGDGEDHDVGIVDSIDGDIVTVRWDTLVVTQVPLESLDKTTNQP